MRTAFELGHFALEHSDEEKAFPLCDHSVILGQVGTLFPEGFGMVANAVGAATQSWYYGCTSGPSPIVSSKGLPQGPPDSPQLFSIARAPHNQRIDALARQGGGFAKSYIDDKCYVSDLDHTYACMCADFAGTRDVGLMNRAKSIVLFPALGNSALVRKWHTLFCELGLLSSYVLVHPSDYLLVPELRQSSVGYGKRILGIPVGSDEYRSQ